MADYPYIVLLFCLLYLTFEEWSNPRNSKYFTLACGVVFSFVAFRAPVVGADTWEYYSFAMGRQASNLSVEETEPLYVLYSSFFAKFCRIGVFFMLANTLLIFWPLYYIINKYVKYRTLSVLCFFILFTYVSYFVALRQVLSESVILLGAIYVLNDKKRKWLLFVLLSVIAFFIHRTSVVMALVFYACYFINLSSRVIAIGVIIFSTIIGIAINTFDPLNFFNLLLESYYKEHLTHYSGFMMAEYDKDTGLYIGNFINSAIGVICFLFIGKEKINNWFSKIYLAGIVLYSLFKAVPMVDRMTFPYLIFVIVVFPWILESKKYICTPSFRKGMNAFLLVLILAFSGRFLMKNISYDLRDFSMMHPYYFFFEDYSRHPGKTS